jgi:hypothetical protein
MKKKFGKNEASDYRAKNTVIMIVSILSVSLFIGTAIEPVMAGRIPNQQTELAIEECLPCKVQEKPPECETCMDAVELIFNETIIYVTTNLPNESFPGKGIELLCYIYEGIIIGIDKSDFEFEYDEDELKENITYWIDQFLHPNQEHNITVVLMALVGIVTGVVLYFLKQCNDENSKNLQYPRHEIPQLIQRTINLILLKINN